MCWLSVLLFAVRCLLLVCGVLFVVGCVVAVCCLLVVGCCVLFNVWRLFVWLLFGCWCCCLVGVCVVCLLCGRCFFELYVVCLLFTCCLFVVGWLFAG